MNNQFVSRFTRLNPSLKVVIQENQPDCLPQGHRYNELKTDKDGAGYFDKGIFRFRETSSGFKKFVVTPRIDGQLAEEVIFGDNTLCRKVYNEAGKQQMMFCYRKVSGCIREEIFDEFNDLKSRSIYRPNSDNDIDFPEICFRGKLSHRRPVYLLERYKILFGENCTRSVYDEEGELAQQEIHKSGKVVYIQQKQNFFNRLFRRPRAKVSYAGNACGDERAAMVECFDRAQEQLSRAEFVRMRYDGISFYHEKHVRQR